MGSASVILPVRASAKKVRASKYGVLLCGSYVCKSVPNIVAGSYCIIAAELKRNLRATKRIMLINLLWLWTKD